MSTATRPSTNLAEKFIDVVGTFATLEDANRAVQDSQQEFIKKFGINDPTNEHEGAGFRYEDHGSHQYRAYKETDRWVHLMETSL